MNDDPLILLIGPAGAGKTTLANKLKGMFPEDYPSISLDKMREDYGNGKFSGEFAAWSFFLRDLEEGYGIFEYPGMTRHNYFVRNIFIKKPENLRYIIHLTADNPILYERFFAKKKDNFNYPFDFYQDKESIEKSITNVRASLLSKNYEFEEEWSTNYLEIDTTSIPEELTHKIAYDFLKNKGVTK